MLNLKFWRRRQAAAHPVDPTMDSPDTQSEVAGEDSDNIGQHTDATTEFTFGGLRFAAGLDWTELAGSGAPAQDLAGAERSYYIGTTRGTATHVLGLGSRSAQGLICAAAVIASRYPEALIRAQLPGTNVFWVCLITDGMPAPMFDVICAHKEDADKYYSEAYAFVDSPACVRIGVERSDSASLEGVLKESLDALFEGCDSAKAKAAVLASYRLHAKKFNWKRFLAIFLSALIVLGAAVTAYAYREHLTSRRKAQALLEQSIRTRQAQEAKQARLQQLLSEFERSVSDEKAKVGRAGLAIRQWRECETLRRAIPISIYGYAAQRLVCEFNEGRARIYWMPAAQSVRIADRAAIPGIIDKYDPVNPAASEYVLKRIEVGNPVIPMKSPAVRMAILDWAGVRMKGLQLSPPVPITVVPPKDLSAEGGVDTVRIGQKSELTVAANATFDVLMLDDAIRMLDSFPVMLTRAEWREPMSANPTVSLTAILSMPD